MTLPVGRITLSEVNTELNIPSTTLISLGQSNVRTLAGVPSGAISLSNLQGKSNTFSFSLTSATNVDLRSAAIAAGWPGSNKVNATIPAAVTISSTTTGTAALTIAGAFPQGVTLNNQGLIVGRGGDGGRGGGSASPAQSGGGGGTAITISATSSINNTGTIAGGGGGGSGGSAGYVMGLANYTGGGGGGGGAGGSTGGSGGTFNPGGSGQPGQPGSIPTYGAGGSATPNASPGQPGGAWGSSSGGSGGSATSGAPTYVTWIATGTRYGAIN